MGIVDLYSSPSNAELGVSGTVLKPRPGYRYEFAVSYKDNIYNVVLRESDPRRGASREVPRQELRGCSA